MSFKPITFTYTPPPTVPAPQVPATTVSAVPQLPVGVVSTTPSVPLGSVFQNSNAGKLVQRFQALSNTTDYLVSVVNALCSNLSITVDPTVEPNVVSALSRLYASTTPIPGIDMTMYNNLLTSEMGLSRIDIALDPNSPQMVNPIQRDDLGTVNRAFENTLVSNGSYNNQLPLLLRPLAGDKLIFDHTVSELQDYPVLRMNNAAATDVSPGITDQLNNTCDRYQTLYASAYTMLATPDYISMNAPSVISALTPSTNAATNALAASGNDITSALTSATMGITGAESTVISAVSKVLAPVNSALAALASILTMLNALKTVFHAQTLHNLVGGLSFIVPRLAAELVIHMLHLDRFLQLATSQVSAVNTEIQTALDATSQLYGTILGIGLTPVIMKHQLSTLASIAQGQAVSKQPTPSLSATGIPQELLKVGAMINWAKNESQYHAQAILTNCQKLLDMRFNAQGDMLEVMSSLKSVEALVAITQSLINVQGSVASAGVSAANSNSTLTAFGQIMNGLNTTSGASYATVGDQLVITPPNIPTPPIGVANVLTNGGATLGNTNYIASSKL